MSKIEKQEQHIIVSPLEEIMGERFGRYSKYIIQDRALPDARDGLKPVQRRILYAMREDGNTFDRNYRKSVKTVGLVIGNYHPHGDSSVYDAMVRMSQNWKSKEPLIDMHGNNGSIDDDPAAAMRYTEARLSKIAEYMLADIEKDTVLFAPNFDDEITEPTVLPTRYPNLLINGISGIAAGYATNIPPHNLSEVLDATMYRVQFPNSNLDELMEYIQGPDFPTGGIVQGLDGIRDAFASGKGKVMIRARIKKEIQKTIQQLIIYEIPYEVVKSNLVRKIDEIRLLKKIDGILDVRDESDRNGLRIVIDLKKDANDELVLNYLYKHTDLQVSYNYNVIAIVNKRPMQLGLAAMLDAFIAHRKEVVLRRSQYEYEHKEKRCHIIEGLIKAIDILDEIIRLIRASKDKGESKKRIIEAFQFSEEQAEAIVTMRLYRLSSTDITQLQKEFALLASDMEFLEDVMSNEKILKKVIIDELNEVKKEFGRPRATSVEAEIEEIVIDRVQMVAKEQVMVSISKDGYMKKSSLRSFAASDPMPGMKEDDQLIGTLEVSTLDQILFFTNKGTYGYVSVYEIDEYKWKDVGMHINSLLKISSSEKIIAAFALSTFQTAGTITSVSKLGMIKRSEISEFEVSRNNKTMTSMKLSEQDEVIACQLAYGHEDVSLIVSSGYMSRYPLSLVPTTAPKSRGVKAMNIGGDEIVSMAMIQPEKAYLFVETTTGAYKRVKTEELQVMGRPVKGEMICKKVKSNPFYMQYIKNVDVNDELMIYSEGLQVLSMKDVAIMSKSATFSTPISYDAKSYIIDGIQKIEIRAKIEEEINSKQASFEEVTFDL